MLSHWCCNVENPGTEMALRSLWSIPQSIFCQEETSRRVLVWSLCLSRRCCQERNWSNSPVSPMLTAVTKEVQLPWSKPLPFRFHQMRVWPWDSNNPTSDSPEKALGWKMCLETTMTWANPGPIQLSKLVRTPKIALHIELCSFEEEDKPWFASLLGWAGSEWSPHARGSTKTVNYIWFFISN